MSLQIGAKDNVDQQKAQRLGHFRDYKTGLQPSLSARSTTWGVAPGCYGTRRWHILTMLVALGSTFFTLTGCKSAPPTEEKPEVVSHPQTPQRPSVAPATFKVFHQDGPKFVLTVSETATDDQIAALIWQLRDAAQANKFDTLKISQKAVDQRDPNATFNIYRGTKCATERYADGPPPCGASYHAAGSYTFGSYANPKWDDGELIAADGKQTQLWK